jgi:hypothetical protein
LTASEQDWAADKDRFVRDAQHSEKHARPYTRDHGFPLGPLGQQFAALTYALLDANTAEDVLNQVVEAAKGIIPKADLVSVTLRTPDGRFHTPISTAELGPELDNVQYELGEGPCITAADPDGPAQANCPDLRDSPNWPRFGAAAVKLGMGAVLSTALVPSPTPPRLSGALNLYSKDPHGLDDVDADVVLLLSTHASLALATTEAVTRADLREAELRRAIDSRDVIGQAKGIIMARRGVPADEAFDILRRTSQDLNVKLVRLAETLAERHSDLDLP